MRKITQAPIKYVVYSHSHFDHIAGGKPFKDVGATFVSHWRTKMLLDERKAPDIVSPDLVVTDSGGKLELGQSVVAAPTGKFTCYDRRRLGQFLTPIERFFNIGIEGEFDVRDDRKA